MAHRRNRQKSIGGVTIKTVRGGRVSKPKSRSKKIAKTPQVNSHRQSNKIIRASIPRTEPGSSACLPIVLDSDDEETIKASQVGSSQARRRRSRVSPTTRVDNSSSLSESKHSQRTPPKPCERRSDATSSNAHSPAISTLKPEAQKPSSRLPIKDEDDEVMVKIDPNDPAFHADPESSEDEPDIQPRSSKGRRERRRRNSIDREFLVGDDAGFEDSEESYASSSSKESISDSDSSSSSESDTGDLSNVEEEEDEENLNATVDLHIDMRSKYAFNAHLFRPATRSQDELSQRISRSQKKC